MSKETGKPKASNIVVWAILGLLILALGGFGVGQFGGSLQTLATVGSREVSVNDYARAIQNEQRAMSQRTGQALTLQQMQLFGMDRQILEGLLTRAALEHEASEMGVSIGDQEVATRILGTQAFQGMTGQFDREVYAQSLRQNGLNESRYEDQVRADGAREILQAAVIGGIPVPEVFTDTIVTWLAETRDATFAEVTVAALPTGPVAPSPEDMQQFYDDNLDRFAVPETRQITYAWVTPDALADTVEVSEER
ncbi:MAG: SurA N-terminal domain-containing protein, partial [Pseudomonadota bacterium]